MSSKPKEYNYFLYVALAVISAAAVLYFEPYRLPVHHDVAGSINDAGLFLRSKEVVQNFGGPIVPLEHLLYGLPHVVSGVTGIPVIEAYRILLLVGLEFMALLACLTFPKPCNTNKWRHVFFSILIFSAIFFLPFNFMYRHLFGTREHLIVAFILPYFALLFRRLDGGDVGKLHAIFVGLFAAIGFSLKPLYALVFIFSELVFIVLVRKRSAMLRPEALLCSALGLLYLCFWLMFFPKYFSQTGVMYSAIAGSFKDPAAILGAARTDLMLVIIVVLSGIVLYINDDQRLKGPRLKQGLLFIAAALSCALITYIQRRWFVHHRFPTHVFALLLLVTSWPLLQPMLIASLLCSALIAYWLGYLPNQVNDILMLLAAEPWQTMLIARLIVGALLLSLVYKVCLASYRSVLVDFFSKLFSTSWIALRPLLIAIALAYPLLSYLKGYQKLSRQQMVIRRGINSFETDISGQTVGLLSSHLRPYHTLFLEKGAHWHFPWRNMSYLDSVYVEQDKPKNSVIYLPPSKYPPQLKAAHDVLISFLKTSPPRFLIVDHSMRIVLNFIRLDYIKALEMDPRFEPVWSRYHLVERKNPKRGLKFDVFELGQ